MSGSFSSICSGGRWVRSRWRWSLAGPTPRPWRISVSMARLTRSRGARSFTVEVAGSLLVGDHAGHAPLGVVAHEGHVEDLELVEEDHAPGHALLVERLEDHVAGAVGGEARPADGGLAVVAGVAAEATLVDQALLRAVEGQAEVLELDDGVDRLPAHDLRRRLVDEIVTALDRVEGVP